MHHHAIRSRAFTLIELLVVISIIAILASILMPTIALVRDSAKSMACVNNLRQIALAYNAYATDNEGALPNVNRNNFGNRNQPDPTLLDDYISTSLKSWTCTASYFPKNNFQYYMYWLLHSTNVHFIQPGQVAAQMARIKHPTEAFICADLNNAAVGGYHRDRSNAAMVDGHVLMRADSAQKIPYAQAIAWADPGPTMWSEQGASAPGLGPSGESLIKGYTY